VTLLASIVPSAVDVAIIAHPGSITAKDFAVIPKEKAVGLICAQEDMSFPDDVRDKVIKGLQARGNLSESKIYKNTTHGFAAVSQ
jgi:dienelactone hydrolase